jgi:hypothetical protein
VKAFAFAETGIALSGLIALTTALCLPAQISKWSREHALVGDLPPGKISVRNLLKVWSNLRGAVAICEAQAADTEINFVVRETPLDWELTKRILDCHDVVLETKEVNGHELDFAQLRRRCCTSMPIQTTEVETSEVVTAVLEVNREMGTDVFAILRGLLIRDEPSRNNISYIRNRDPGRDVIVIVDGAAAVDSYVRVTRVLRAQRP